MKFLVYSRHAEREGENISQAGLDITCKNVLAGGFTDAFTDIFFSPIARTSQTALAWASAMNNQPKIHAAINEIGCDELFDEIYTPELEKEEENFATTIEALEKCGTLEKWQSVAAQGIIKMFDLIDRGGHGLAIGHEPIISLAALAFNHEMSTELEPLGFIQFGQPNDHKILVMEHKIRP